VTQEELTTEINKVFDAVDKSKLGPILVGPADPYGIRGVSSIGMSTFLNVLGNIVPTHHVSKTTGRMTMEEPGESWKPEE
jgi:hypothetical protein